MLARLVVFFGTYSIKNEPISIHCVHSSYTFLSHTDGMELNKFKPFINITQGANT